MRIDNLNIRNEDPINPILAGLLLIALDEKYASIGMSLSKILNNENLSLLKMVREAYQESRDSLTENQRNTFHAFFRKEDAERLDRAQNLAGLDIDSGRAPGVSFMKPGSLL